MLEFGLWCCQRKDGRDVNSGSLDVQVGLPSLQLMSFFLSFIFTNSQRKIDATMCEALLSNIDSYSHHSRPPLHPHDGQRGISCPGTVEDGIRAKVHLQGLRFRSHAGANCEGQPSLTLLRSIAYRSVMSHA